MDCRDERKKRRKPFLTNVLGVPKDLRGMQNAKNHPFSKALQSAKPSQIPQA